MTIDQIASRLVELCRRCEYDAAQKELYADDVVSVEPDGTPGNVVRGRAALIEKNKMFHDTFAVHGGSASDPVCADPFFSYAMSADVTDKRSGARFTISEICVFEVRDGKIVREQFFYPPKG